MKRAVYEILTIVVLGYVCFVLGGVCAKKPTDTIAYASGSSVDVDVSGETITGVCDKCNLILSYAEVDRIRYCQGHDAVQGAIYSRLTGKDEYGNKQYTTYIYDGNEWLELKAEE